MGTGLFEPLQPPRGDWPARASRRYVVPVAAGFAIAALCAVWILVAQHDGSRGEPRVTVPIERVATPPVVQAPAIPPTVVAPPSMAPSASLVAQPPAPATALPAVREDQDVEIQNGVRIIRPHYGRAAPVGQTLSVAPGSSPVTVLPQVRSGQPVRP